MIVQFENVKPELVQHVMSLAEIVQIVNFAKKNKLPVSVINMMDTSKERAIVGYPHKIIPTTDDSHLLMLKAQEGNSASFSYIYPDSIIDMYVLYRGRTLSVDEVKALRKRERL
jgi:hypothetical protein